MRSHFVSLALAIGLVASVVPCYGEECLADPAWFPGGMPDPKPVSPTLSLPPGTDECAFYKWAWQTFLYVTRASGPNHQPRFVHYTSPIDLFANQTPQKLALVQRKKGALNLMPRGAKSPSATTVDDVIQSLSKGLVVDHSGRAVYYGTHLNEVFVEFVHHNGFDTDVKKIGTFDANTPVDPGALELKSSWKILDPAKDDKRQFFTIDTDVPSLAVADDPDHPGQKMVVVDLHKPRHETLALVGLHVVGTVKDHPEFIWATFEHIKNAPGLTSQKVRPDDVVDAAADYTFYEYGTKRSQCNVNARLTLNLASQKLAPVTEVFRQFRYGGPDDSMTGTNDPDPDVASLNKDVRARLKQANSVWQNYFLLGAVWIDNPAKDFAATDDTIADDVLKGETRLSNSTMETFTQHEKQVSPPPGPTKPNCFRCHSAAGETKIVNGTSITLKAQKINVSHALTNAFFRQ